MKHEVPAISGPLQVSVHVRRGDVNRGMTARHRDYAYFERCLDAVALGAGSTPMVVTIHSQGAAPSISVPSRAKVVSDLDGDPVKTMLAMASSDVLITSPSSFSMTAGFLSKGLVIREEPWWHSFPEGDRWLAVYTRDGLPTRQSLGEIAHEVSARLVH
ncbi:hypothetical protein ABC795_01290 [Blastococcus sp. HT6-30]|uniref:hypothetical protein n=1 Tax=Blastococcus sp. HT6-30 TaxID=3144843 RepID=UPI003219329D